jgi:hypothetical protein
MLVYTSITKNYLPKARILAKSVKKYHPDWFFVVIVSDALPESFNLNSEPFDEVVTLDLLPIENWRSWAYGHDLVELCTAVKGPAAKMFAARPGVERIMYLDPDIKVFSSLRDLESELTKGNDILLTPHLLHIETEMEGICDNELSVLKHGIFNLGFFAATTSGEGLKFIHWWSDRLEQFCLNDIPNGLFTDQKWCDEAPAFFEKLHIVRDLGCNVATWNIAHRPLSKNHDGQYFAGEDPLKFYHFTGYDSGAGAQMLNKYAESMSIAHEVWEGYQADLIREGHESEEDSSWSLAFFEDGTPIDKQARRFYRSRLDLKSAFPNPYSVDEPSFRSWWADELKSRDPIFIHPPKSIIRRALSKTKRLVRQILNA